MKKFVTFYLLIALIVAAMRMQEDAASFGGTLGAGYFETLRYVFEALLWPIDLLQWLFS